MDGRLASLSLYSSYRQPSLDPSSKLRSYATPRPMTPWHQLDDMVACIGSSSLTAVAVVDAQKRLLCSLRCCMVCAHSASASFLFS